MNHALLTTIILFTMIVFGQKSINNIKMSDMDKMETCLSGTNFDSVYKYIDTQIKKSNKPFYRYGNYELYLNATMEISFKKDGYTLSKIGKEKGIVSLAKRKQDNDKIIKETDQLFCELLLSADRNK